MRGEQGAIHDRLLAACSIGGLVPRITRYFLDEDTQLAMVASGMGVTLTLEAAVTRRWRRHIAFRLVTDLDVAVDLDLIWNEATVSDAARRVMASIALGA